MPRNRFHQPNKRRKYAPGKVKLKTNQSVKSTEVDSTIYDSSCIDEHNDNDTLIRYYTAQLNCFVLKIILFHKF